VRFLVDANLSPRLAAALIAAGHDAVHVRELGMSSATDTAIIEAAEHDRRIVLSADTDFGTILALTGRTSPSVLLLRLTSPRRTELIAALLDANLPDVAEPLAAGAVVVVEDDRVRVRSLPLR
jgi:predicted nuclease of predicted toxin-antitoxin system